MNPSKPKLSARPTPDDLTIALCTIGRPGYLQVAIGSLLATTPPGVTLHVVLNAVDDPELVVEIRRLVARWAGPTRVTELDQRLAIAGSHAVALSAADTDFITFMGDDDLVLEPRVQRLLDIFWTTTPMPVVVGSFCRRVSGSPSAPRFTTNKDYGPPSVADWEAARTSGELLEVVFPSAIYYRPALVEVGGFEDRFGSAMDLVTFTRLGQTAPVLADPRRSFAHRIHDGSVTTSQASQHAMRLRYASRCMEAMRAGTPEPSWETFIAEEHDRPYRHRAAENRRTMSAALFREGGAAVASGNRIRGAAKAALSAILSPRTFLRRSRAQVAQSNAAEPVVTILVKNCNQYRIAFYNQLRAALAEKGIELRLIVGGGLPEDAAKGDVASLAWAEQRDLIHVRVLGKDLLWQPAFDAASQSDLIITEQASKQLFNVVLSYGQRLFHARHAFWGHGRNFQASFEGQAGEGLKRRLTRRAHWFFAYNDSSAAAVSDAGFPAERITSVMNSTDTTQIRAVRSLLPHDVDSQVRAELGMGYGPVALYLGGIYKHKRPEFLIDAAQQIRERIPGFEMLVIGSGSSAHLVEDASARWGWFHHVGPVYGDERIRLASVCSVQLMPGLVGLNVVDAFALGIPTVTTAIDYHSPEIEYLVDGENGLIAARDVTATEYAELVSGLLEDTERLVTLQKGASVAGMELSVERMADNFADGVVQALKDVG